MTARNSASGLDPRLTVLAVATGLWGAAAVLAPGSVLKFAVIAPPLIFGFVLLLASRPEWGLIVFLMAAVLTPPLPFAAGNSGAHVAPFVAAALVVAGVLRFRDWRLGKSLLPAAFLGFTGLLAATSGLALFYSGAEVAAGSLTRVFLFAISVWIFLYSRGAPFAASWNSLVLARWIFSIGVAAALFACVDFYYQLPSLAASAPQFVWLDAGVFRRAQGLFHEASTLGNFCAFSIAMIPAALLAAPHYRPMPLLLLAFGGIPIWAALMFSYSRGSLINIAVVMLAFVVLRGRMPAIRSLLTMAAALAGASLVGIALFPTFFGHYWTRLGVAFQYFTVSPDRVLSGRLVNWSAVLDFLTSHPWLLFFGIGYKTLPYTSRVPGGVVADNTYLSLLAETGIAGLFFFLALNGAMLRTSFRAAHSLNGRAAFFGSWIFCFWCGEMMQMISGDLITYWRVLPVYFCALGVAAREAGE